jgi:nucleotide-binding universal stress UspA family protein
VTTISRVIVGVSGSPGCLPAMRYAAELARAHQAPLILALAWLPPGGDLADRSHPSPALRQVWVEAARRQLETAVRTAFGGLPAGLAARPEVVRGEPGQSLVQLASQAGDLLVIGTGRRTRVTRALRAGVGRYCLAHAACPVLAVPPSPLDDELGRFRLRGWALWRRAVNPDDITVPPANIP